MKTIVNVLLMALLVSSNGCMSMKVADLAKGHTTERIDASKIENGDKVVDLDGGSGIAYVIQHPKGEDTSRLKMPAIPSYYEFYIARPRPAYYALMPLSIPADIATLPIQVIVVGVLTFTMPPVSH
jgi:hypothetical protein